MPTAIARTQTGFRLTKEELKLLEEIRRGLEEDNPGFRYTRIDALRAAIRSYKGRRKS